MEDFTLRTAENVSVRYDVATAGSRSAAFLIDYIMILVTSLGFAALVLISEEAGTDTLSPYFAALFYIVVGTLSWAYFVVSEMVLNGSSIGKRIFDLKVIKEDGSPIDLVDSLTRNFIRYVDLWPGTYLVGFVAMMLNEKSKRLGDYAAGTLVVRVHTSYLDRLELEETEYDEIVENNPNLSLITPEEYQLMRDYLTQKERVSPYRSSRIAVELARRMAEKLQIEPPTDGEKCLKLLLSCVKHYR